jgi:hypothetical protein
MLPFYTSGVYHVNDYAWVGYFAAVLRNAVADQIGPLGAMANVRVLAQGHARFPAASVSLLSSHRACRPVVVMPGGPNRARG